MSQTQKQIQNNDEEFQKVKQGKDYKADWNVAKYAPVKYKINGPTATMRLTQDRQSKHAQAEKTRKAEASSLIAAANERDAACTQLRVARAYNARERRIRAETARVHYRERQEKRLEKTRLTNPALDLNLNQRVHFYAKYHKCPHGLANNRIQIDGDRYVINCDHDKCEKTTAEAVKCRSCGSFMTVKYTNIECHCSFYSCPRCKRAQYLYDFRASNEIVIGGNPVPLHNFRMCYDKHNIQRTQVRITTTDTVSKKTFDSILPPKVTSKQKESRKRFLLDMSTPTASSFAGSVTRFASVPSKAKPIPKPRKSVLFAKVPDVKSEPVPLKDLVVETVPQGAVLSNAASPFVSASRNIRRKYREMRDKALNGIDDLQRKIGKNIAQAALKELTTQVFDALRYLVGIVYDYCYVLNPVFLYRLWNSRTEPVMFLLNLGEALLHLKEYEQQNKSHAYTVLLSGVQRFMIEYADGGSGVLRTILHYKLRNLKNPSIRQLRQIIEQAGVTGAFKLKSKRDNLLQNAGVDGDCINTTAESGSDSLMEAIGSLLSTFPRSLGCGITFLRHFFKENMPILMGLRALSDLTKITKKLIDSGMKIFYGRCASPKEWLEMQLCTDDNPIHAVTCTYMTYMGIVSGFQSQSEGLKNDQTLNDLRNRFFMELSAADKYVKDEGKLCHAWFSFKAQLTNTFNVPPIPKVRAHEPMCLVLSGGAGMGKSTLWKVLLSRELCPGETKDVSQKMEDMTHTWNAASEYQPNMASKKIIVFDDFMQNIAEVNEALQIISLCTRAPYPVNTATITGPDIKGLFCEPDAIVCCTNTTSERAAQKLADPAALLRRYDLDLEVCSRYDPQDKTKPIFKVVSCPMFKSLTDRILDMESARQVVSVIFRKKRAEFKNVSNMVETLLGEDVDIDACEIGHGELKTIANAWQQDADFYKAFNEYLVNPAANPAHKIEEPDTDSESEDEDVDRIDYPLLGSDSEDDEEVKPPPAKDRNKLVRFSKNVINKLKKAPEVVHTNAQGLAQYGVEALHILYSNMLTGAMIGAPVAVAMSFASFLHTLTSDVFGLIEKKLKGEPGCYLYIKRILTQLMKCAVVTLSSGLALFATFKIMAKSSSQESGTTRTAKPRSSQVQTFEQSGVSEGQLKKFVQATGSVMVLRNARTTNCVFVGGHYILVPYHLFTDHRGQVLPDGEEIEITKVSWRDSMKIFHFEQKSLVRLKGNIEEALSRRLDTMPMDTYREDVCLYKLPASMFSAEANIVKHFWNGAYGTKNISVRKLDYIPYNTDHTYNGQVIYNDGTVVKDSISTPRFEGEFQRFHVLAEATYAGRNSSCGSLVIRPDVQETPILGVHTAANDRGSYFHYVTRQSLESAMSKNTVTDVESRFVHSEPQASVLTVLPKESILYPVGEIEKPLFQPTKTDLQPSLLYEVMGPAMTAPAPLSHKDPRIDEKFSTFSAFWQQMFKDYSRPFKPAFTPAELNSVYISMVDDFKRIKARSIVPTKKLDLMESLNGLSHIPQNTRMPMNTSCGFPYVQEGLKKNDLFEERDGRLYPSARIIADYEHAVSLLEKGVVPYLPYVLSLKDERLKHAKITTPRTRIFTCGNVVCYLICRRYFYSAIMQYYHADLSDSFCYPSLDRASFDWNYLSRHMLEVGDRGFDFDFSHFDRSLSHQLLYFGTKLLLNGLSLPPQEEAAVIELVCSPYIIWGKSVMRGTFLPSGILITFLLNCVSNEMMHRMAWRDIMAREMPSLLPMRYYHDYTRGVRGGDDTFTTVDGRVLPYYNGKTVAEYLRSRGMQVTAADKSQNIPESTNYFDLSFLKNSTKYERGAYLPLPELRSLFESSYWVRLSPENNDIVKATQDNATCSLRSIYFHGEEIFNDFRDKALEKEPRLVLPSYEELSVIWDNYHCYPGSHTDFASRELQEDPFTSASKELPRVPATERAKFNMSPIEIIETYIQSGLSMTALDKQSLGSAAIETAAVTEEVGEVGDEIIDNQTIGTPGKTLTDAVGASIQDGPSSKAKPVKTGAQLIQSQNLRSEAYLNDINWDLKKLVQKFTYVKDFTWSTSDPVNTIIASLKAPRDFLVTPAQKEPFDVTKYWKGTLLVKVVIKSSPFYAGGLVIGFSPFQKTPTLASLVNMGALIHKLSQEEGLEFVIPFRWPTGFIDAASDELGTFAIIVNSTLRTGTDNPNTISGAIYVSIMDSEFKLPEVVPSAAYQSFKFNSSVVQTRPQSGVSVKSVLCDINDLPSKMPTTVMCAGTGTLGSPTIPHFQDAPSDLMQLLKRWEMAGRLSINLAAGGATVCSFSALDIYKAAFRGFDKYFGLFRGSVNLRFSLEASNDSIYGKISFNPVFAHANAQQPSNCGLQTFDRESMGMVTIPWTQPTFTAPTDGANMSTFVQQNSMFTDVVTVVLYNHNADVRDVILNVDVSVGDDLHMGVFLGTPFNPGFPTVYRRIPLLPFEVKHVAPEYDAEYPIPTVPQSGMLQFVGRAIENTLPIVEQMSELGLELDAHMITEQNQLVQQRRRPFSIASDLPVLTERFTTVNHNGMSLPDKQCFGSDKPETDIYNLLQNTKSLMDRFKWGADKPAGALLAEYSNRPSVAKAGNPSGIHAQLCSMFNFWTGGRIIILDVHATQMHRGQLLLAYSTDEKDIVYADATQTYFTTLDLSEGRATVALCLPYLSPIPQRRVPPALSSDAEADSPVCTVGKLRVFVQNPLRSTSTVAPDVEIVVYESCAADFQVNVYGGTPYTVPEPPVMAPAASSHGVPVFNRKPLIRATLPKITRPGYDNA